MDSSSGSSSAGSAGARASAPAPIRVDELTEEKWKQLVDQACPWCFFWCHYFAQQGLTTVGAFQQIAAGGTKFASTKAPQAVTAYCGSPATSLPQVSVGRTVSRLCQDDKQWTVVCSNLAASRVQTSTLRSALDTMFSMLPDFHRYYANLRSVVLGVTFVGIGSTAFVEFADEILASTAVRIETFELCGHKVRMRRPKSCLKPSGGWARGLNVEPLRLRGIIPERQRSSRLNEETLRRQLYIGNLQACGTSYDDMFELLSTLCQELPDYRPELGPAVNDIVMLSGGHACFAVFQSEDLALSTQATLRIAVFQGHHLTVRRPNEVQASRGPFRTAACL